MRRGIPAWAPALALAAATALVALGGLAGCAKVRGVMAPNRAPETTVWVTGTLDTVTHYQRVFWDGQDVDGRVVGFEFKWIYDPASAPAGYDSSQWTFTPRHDSLFAVWSPDGVDYPTLVVRAIDDKGAADPTPARQRFGFTNLPPTVNLTVTPPDSTLPVATFGWAASDPDGAIALAHYQVTLDGSTRDTLVSATGITLPPYFFENDQGQIEQRQRTISVTCIDDGGRASAPASFSWFVRSPAGTTLLVNDTPSAFPAYGTFYRTELTNRLGAGNYSVLDLERGAYFRTPDAIRETFLLFQNVFWCSDGNPSLSTVLQMADQPVRDYLSAGRNLFLSSSCLVGDGGALGKGFARDVLGVSALRVNQLDGTTGFSISIGQFLIGGASPFDSLRAQNGFSGIEALVLADPGDAAYLAPPGTLDTLHVDDWPVAVSRRYGGGQGRVVYLGFPLYGMRGPFSLHAGRAAVELGKVFDLFGMH